MAAVHHLSQTATVQHFPDDTEYTQVCTVNDTHFTNRPDNVPYSARFLWCAMVWPAEHVVVGTFEGLCASLQVD